jgi:hypothetical protein
MRRSLVLGALLLAGFMAVGAAAPSADLGALAPAIAGISEADAALGRGGGGGGAGGGGGHPGVLDRFASLIQDEFAAGFFIAVAIGLTITVVQRNAGAAVGVLVAALVIGAFLLVPNQVETLFRSVYQFVL